MAYFSMKPIEPEETSSCLNLDYDDINKISKISDYSTSILYIDIQAINILKEVSQVNHWKNLNVNNYYIARH
jgi:hypothetical protein